MGTQILAAAEATAKSSSSSFSLLIIVVVFALMMVFMFRSQKKRKLAAQQTQNQVQTGSRIRTVHGIYGTVVDGDDRNVIVEIAPGVKIKMLRQAIGTVVPDDEPDGLQPTMRAFDETGPDLNGDQGSTKPDDRSDATL